MTRFSVLYTQEAKKETGWREIPDNRKVGRLREVYWASKAMSNKGSKSFINMTLNWQPDRTELGRKADDPGDVFLFNSEVYPKQRGSFEWIEVTEVFTAVPAEQIEEAMEAWNGIWNKRRVDFFKFRETLNTRRPSREEQRQASDVTIQQIKGKLKKDSYHELVEMYGYGTLVVGLPLWFATPPDDPWRIENVLEDFWTRTAFGLKELKRKMLRKSNCPFQKIIVVWDTSPEALQKWNEKKSSVYKDPANVRFGSLLSVERLGFFFETLIEDIPELGLEESDLPSVNFKIEVQTGKKKSGKGPYPEFVTLLEKINKKNKTNEIPNRLRLWYVQALLQMVGFVKIHGFDGLKRRIMRIIPIPHSAKLWVARLRAKRLFLESNSRSEEIRSKVKKD